MNDFHCLVRNTAAVAIAAAFTFNSAVAQSIWDGGGANNLWLTPENWQGDTAPTSASTTNIQIAGTTNLSIDIASAFTLRTLVFNSGTGTSSLSGAAITIHGAGNDSTAAVTNSSANLQTINNNFVIAGQTAFLNSSGGLTLAGNIQMNQNVGFQNFNTAFSKSLNVNGVLSGAGTVNFNGSAGGYVIVNGVNSYTGNTRIFNSTVVVGTDVLTSTNSAFGNSAAAIQMGNTGAALTPTLLTDGVRTVDRAIQILSPSTGVTTATIGGNTAHVSTYSKDITMGSASSAAQALSVTAVSGGRVNISGNLVRASGATGTTDTLTKKGAGIVALSGLGNDYSGATTVSAGVFLVNGVLSAGGGDVTVQSGATLGGEGTINRNIVVQGGGILSTGDFDGSGFSEAGELTTVGNVSFASTSILLMNLGTFSDTLSITGNLTLDGTLSVSALSGFGAGTYELISYTGSFVNNGLLIGSEVPSGYTYSIDTSTLGQINLVVSAVPEPSTWAFFAGIAALGFVSVRHRGRLSR